MAAYAGMAAQAIGHFWFGQPEVAVQAFAAAAIVHVVPNYAPTFDQAKERFEKEIETQETETTTDNIQEIVDSIISETSERPETIITVNHGPTSPAPGTTTTYSKKPFLGGARDASKEKKAYSADKSTSTRDGKCTTSAPPVSAKRPTEKVTPASAGKTSTSSAAVPLVSTASFSQGWGDYFFGTKSEEQTTSPVEKVTSTSDIETSTPASAGRPSTSSAAAPVLSTTSSSQGWGDYFFGARSEERSVSPVEAVTSSPDTETPTSSKAATATSTKSSSKGFLDRLRAKPTEQSTTEPIAEITSAVKSDEHEVLTATEAATAASKTYAIDLIATWFAVQRQGEPSSELSDTVATASAIETPTFAEGAPVTSLKPSFGPFRDWVLAFWWSEYAVACALPLAMWLTGKFYTRFLDPVLIQVLNSRLAHRVRFVWRTAMDNHPLPRVRQNLVRYFWLLIIAGYICGCDAVAWVARNATLGRTLQIATRCFRWILMYSRAIFDFSFDTFGPLVHAIICVGVVLVFTILMSSPLRIPFTWVYQVIKTIAHTVGNSEAWSTAETSAQNTTPATTARMTAVLDEYISPVLAFAWETFTLVFRATWTVFEHMYCTVVKPVFDSIWSIRTTAVWNEYICPILAFAWETFTLIFRTIWAGFEHMYWTVVKPVFKPVFNIIRAVLYSIFANLIVRPVGYAVWFCTSHWCECLHRRWLLRLPTLVFLTAPFVIACIIAVRSYPRRKLRSLITVVLSFVVPYALSFLEAVGGLECTQDYIIVLCTLLLFLFWKRPTQALKAALDDGAPDMSGGTGTEVEEAPETVRDGSTPAPVDDQPGAGSEGAAQTLVDSTASPTDAQPEPGRASASQIPDDSTALPPLPDSPPSSGSPDVPAPQTPIVKEIPSALDGHKKKKKSLGAGESAPEPEVDDLEWQKVFDLAFGQGSSDEQPTEEQPIGDEQPTEDQPTEDQSTQNQAAPETEPNNVLSGWFNIFQPVKTWWDDLRATANAEVEAMDRKYAEERAAAEASKRATWSVGDIAPLADRSPKEETNVQKQLAQKKAEDYGTAEEAQLKAIRFYNTKKTEWDTTPHHAVDTDDMQRRRQEALAKVMAKGPLNSTTLKNVMGELDGVIETNTETSDPTVVSVPTTPFVPSSTTDTPQTLIGTSSAPKMGKTDTVESVPDVPSSRKGTPRFEVTSPSLPTPVPEPSPPKPAPAHVSPFDKYRAPLPTKRSIDSSPEHGEDTVPEQGEVPLPESPLIGIGIKGVETENTPHEFDLPQDFQSTGTKSKPVDTKKLVGPELTPESVSSTPGSPFAKLLTETQGVPSITVSPTAPETVSSTATETVLPTTTETVLPTAPETAYPIPSPRSNIFGSGAKSPTNIAVSGTPSTLVGPPVEGSDSEPSDTSSEPGPTKAEQLAAEAVRQAEETKKAELEKLAAKKEREDELLRKREEAKQVELQRQRDEEAQHQREAAKAVQLQKQKEAEQRAEAEARRKRELKEAAKADVARFQKQSEAKHQEQAETTRLQKLVADQVAETVRQLAAAEAQKAEEVQRQRDAEAQKQREEKEAQQQRKAEEAAKLKAAEDAEYEAAEAGEAARLQNIEEQKAIVVDMSVALNRRKLAQRKVDHYEKKQHDFEEAKQKREVARPAAEDDRLQKNKEAEQLAEAERVAQRQRDEEAQREREVTEAAERFVAKQAADNAEAENRQKQKRDAEAKQKAEADAPAKLAEENAVKRKAVEEEAPKQAQAQTTKTPPKPATTTNPPLPGIGGYGDPDPSDSSSDDDEPGKKDDAPKKSGSPEPKKAEQVYNPPYAAPNSSLGPHTWRPNLDDFHLRTRDADSRERRRNALLGGPSILTIERRRRDKEDADRRAREGGGDGGDDGSAGNGGGPPPGPGGPSGGSRPSGGGGGGGGGGPYAPPAPPDGSEGAASPTDSASNDNNTTTTQPPFAPEKPVDNDDNKTTTQPPSVPEKPVDNNPTTTQPPSAPEKPIDHGDTTKKGDGKNKRSHDADDKDKMDHDGDSDSDDSYGTPGMGGVATTPAASSPGSPFIPVVDLMDIEMSDPEPEAMGGDEKGGLGIEGLENTMNTLSLEQQQQQGQQQEQQQQPEMAAPQPFNPFPSTSVYGSTSSFSGLPQPQQPLPKFNRFAGYMPAEPTFPQPSTSVFGSVDSLLEQLQQPLPVESRVIIDPSPRLPIATSTFRQTYNFPPPQSYVQQQEQGQQQSEAAAPEPYDPYPAIEAASSFLGPDPFAEYVPASSTFNQLNFSPPQPYVATPENPTIDPATTVFPAPPFTDGTMPVDPGFFPEFEVVGDADFPPEAIAQFNAMQKGDGETIPVPGEDEYHPTKPMIDLAAIQNLRQNNTMNPDDIPGGAMIVENGGTVFQGVGMDLEPGPLDEGYVHNENNLRPDAIRNAVDENGNIVAERDYLRPRDPSHRTAAIQSRMVKKTLGPLTRMYAP